MAVAERAMGMLLTSADLRVWGWRSAMSLVDQGLTSGAGFAVNLLLARWMTPEVYGAFAVAYAGFLFVSGFHNVLLLEPLSVIGPSRYAKRLPAYFRAQIMVHLVLVGPLSAVALLASFVLWRISPGSPLSRAVFGAGLTLPFLLLFWLVRRMCYVLHRPSAAALGSGVYLLFVAAGLFVLGHYSWLGSFTAFLLMGCGSIGASWLILRQLGLGEREIAPEHDVTLGAALQENWGYGRWLVGSAVFFAVSSQAQTLLAAGILGLGAAGILRAMQIPSLVMVQIITAAGLLVLPAFSYDFGLGRAEQLRHKAMIVSLGLAIAALCFAATLTLLAGRTEHLLFGGKYAAYAWLMPVLALVPAANGISTGYSMALRALQRPHFDLISNMFAAPVAVVSAFFLMRRWGLAGAAASLALSFGVLSIVTIIFFQRSTREPGGLTSVNNG